MSRRGVGQRGGGGGMENSKWVGLQPSSLISPISRGLACWGDFLRVNSAERAFFSAVSLLIWWGERYLTPSWVTQVARHWPFLSWMLLWQKYNPSLGPQLRPLASLSWIPATVSWVCGQPERSTSQWDSNSDLKFGEWLGLVSCTSDISRRSASGAAVAASTWTGG